MKVDARLSNGLSLQAGTSTGRTMEDDCDIVSKVPEMLLVNLANVGNAAVLIPTANPDGVEAEPVLPSPNGMAHPVQDLRGVHRPEDGSSR